MPPLTVTIRRNCCLSINTSFWKCINTWIWIDTKTLIFAVLRKNNHELTIRLVHQPNSQNFTSHWSCGFQKYLGQIPELKSDYRNLKIYIGYSFTSCCPFQIVRITWMIVKYVIRHINHQFALLSIFWWISLASAYFVVMHFILHIFSFHCLAKFLHTLLMIYVLVHCLSPCACYIAKWRFLLYPCPTILVHVTIN